MPERGFDSEFWTNPKIKKLPMEAGHLYLYLWTNSHCNQAGLYYIALDTIASESKLPVDAIPKLFELLKDKVVWYPDDDLVWVKNFVKRQSKSPKFLAAAAKSLVNIHNHKAVATLLQYNLERYSISIPYQYYIDRLSIPYNAATATGLLSNKRMGSGEGETELAAISKLYEDNIAPLTPMVAERLKDIASSYPPGWFKEALDEAIGASVRKLNYIEAILERWKTEGFKAGKDKEHKTGPRGRLFQGWEKEKEQD